tara:strand:+ start:4714 stop:6048 length:1335 start_codon:yes stop_codon:yes gene_type:complete
MDIPLRKYDIESIVNIKEVIQSKEKANKENLIVKSLVLNDKQYYLIKYNRNKVTINNESQLGLFKSILCDEEKIYSFCPPKKNTFESFIENNKANECRYEEQVEGTMISLFFDVNKEEWEISTRSRIGARCKFYKDAKFTYRYMFLDALNNCNIEFDIFDKKKCYSFVLQHPENKKVIPVKEPKVYLVGVYKLNNFIVEELDAKLEAQMLGIPYPMDFTDYFNKIIDEETDDNVVKNYLHIIYNWEHLTNLMKDYIENKNIYKLAGICIKNKNGERSLLQNSIFEYVNELKGNNPKMQYQYYSLRKLGKVKECLKFYPEYKEKFLEYRENLHTWTKMLHQNYFDCFINKKAPIKDFPHQFKLHMWKLHELYLTKLRLEGKYMSLQEVIKYVNEIPAAKLMYSVNYVYRKIKHDEKINNVKNSLNKEAETARVSENNGEETMTDD